MPNIIYGAQQKRQDLMNVHAADFSYDYPDGLNLKPGSDLHGKILSMLLVIVTGKQ